MSFCRHLISVYRVYNFIDRNKSTGFVLSKAQKAIVLLLYIYYGTLAKLVYGAFLPYKATIGKNVDFVHSLYGVFISQGAIVGDDCKILHHVTIGSDVPMSDSDEIGNAPVIGDRVFIGCNSNIIGKTIVGNDCRIGAGTTIVNGCIDHNSTVVGGQFRVFYPK